MRGTQIKFYKTDTEIKNASQTRIKNIAKYAAKNIKKSDKVLDVLTGYANFLILLTKINKNRIIGIDNSDFILREAKRNVKKEGLANLIVLKKVDARKMPFPNNYFDVVVNYGGWGDVVLTCGKIGIKKIIKEMTRILKPNGKVIVSFVLIEIPRNKIETIDEKLQIYLYGKKRHYPKEYFASELRRNKIKIISQKVFTFSPKRKGPDMTKKSLKKHQKEVNLEFGIKSRSYEQIWKRFGPFIEKNGYGFGKGIMVLVGQKSK